MTTTIYTGDALAVLRTLPDASVNSVVTSPPYYGLRSYFPDKVKIRENLTEDELLYVLGELMQLGISPSNQG
jgi:DNA modification methylase